MPLPIIVDTVAQILLEGMKFMNTSRKEKLMREHHDALEMLNNAKNQKFPLYTDVDVELATQRLHMFEVAYLGELRAELAEKGKT